MAEMSSGTALRQVNQAQAALKKARRLLKETRGASADPDRIPPILKAGWAALAQCHRILAEVPLSAANEEVMTKQLAAQRYATALLVRLRRLARNDPAALDHFEDDDDEDALDEADS